MRMLAIVVIVLTALLVHWRMPRFILGSFLAAIIATLLILAGAFLFLGAKEHEIIIILINVPVLALLISALVGFLFNRQRKKTEYTKPRKTKIERARDTFGILQVALGGSGIVMVALALFHGGTPTHIALEGFIQLGIVYLLHRRWRWALHLLVGYGALAVAILLSLVIADLSLNLGVLTPREAVGTLFGTCTAGWLVFRGAFAYKYILAIEKNKRETQPNNSLNTDAR